MADNRPRPNPSYGLLLDRKRLGCDDYPWSLYWRRESSGVFEALLRVDLVLADDPIWKPLVLIDWTPP